MTVTITKNLTIKSLILGLIAVFAMLTASAAQAQVTAFKQAVAEAASADDGIAAFYRARNFEPIWVGKSDTSRRKALLAALQKAPEHALPMNRYDPAVIRANFKNAKSARDRGLIEVQTTRQFLRYAHDIQSGILTPSSVNSLIARKAPRRGDQDLLEALMKSNPSRFMKSLVPSSPEYTALLKAKRSLERAIGSTGWGPTVRAKSLKPGQSGAEVVALRNRMIRMGYLRKSASQKYDTNLTKAIQLFQQDNGLVPDGVSGADTIKVVNVSANTRLQQVIVAMERRRWLNIDLGKRHVFVNLADFRASIINNGKVEFSTRAVVGKNISDRRTPEFSDVMTHMIINPTWHVPRSIAVKEYLPMLKKNPGAVSHLRMVDASGRTVSRANVDFTAYTTKSFPFNLKQPPSNGNALGRVKFMFPNKHNIYLHDTPAKSLFARNVRAYSHGCIRLADPFDFAYALLSKEMSNGKDYFQRTLKTKVETQYTLKSSLKVHIDYRTAWVPAKGRVNYRRDIYGRDALIFKALAKAGVVLRAVQS